MTEPTSVAFSRFVWLVLTSMMLASRVLFQAAGAEAMRDFLNRWKVSRTRQVWGMLSLIAGLVAGLLAFLDLHLLRWTDSVVIGLLVAISIADGLVNVLPSGFHTFKDTIQTGWVRRHAGTQRAEDRSLFGTVNLILAVAALGWAIAVAVYRPVGLAMLAAAISVALVLTPALVGMARVETRQTRPATRA